LSPFAFIAWFGVRTGRSLFPFVPFFADPFFEPFSTAVRDCGDVRACEDADRVWLDDDDARDWGDEDELLVLLVSLFASSLLREVLEDVLLEVVLLIPDDFELALPFFSVIYLLPRSSGFGVASTGACRRLPLTCRTGALVRSYTWSPRRGLQD
jgi:hypothetical protein